LAPSDFGLSFQIEDAATFELHPAADKAAMHLAAATGRLIGVKRCLVQPAGPVRSQQPVGAADVWAGGDQSVTTRARKRSLDPRCTRKVYVQCVPRDWSECEGKLRPPEEIRPWLDWMFGGLA
jgi:hypothetical protein